MADIKTDQPLIVVTITKSGTGIQTRSFVFDNEDTAKSIADWLSRNSVSNTRMSVRAYEALIAAANERELQTARPARPPGFL